MGFIQDIASVLPTIASIVAPLFSAQKNDYLRFGIGDNQYVHFKKDGNEIMVCNPLLEPIALEFPDKNGVGGETMTIPTGHYPVTQMLIARAGANVDEFQILKGGIVDEDTTNRLSDVEKLEATITASGKMSNVNGLNKIGTALSVSINGSDLSIIVNPPYSLEGITSFDISGDGNQPICQFKNVMNDGSTPTPIRGTNASPLEMNFPNALSSFKDSQKLFVSVSARCSCPASQFKHNTLRGKKAEECDWSFLETGRCLNG